MENRKEQMEETFESLKEYMTNLISGVKKCAGKFQGGNDTEGAELLALISDGIEWVMNALMLTKEIHKQAVDIKELVEFLKEIVEALENQDYILCGDLLEYEVMPILENWNNLINE